MTTDSSCSNIEFYGNIFFNLLLETADLSIPGRNFNPASALTQTHMFFDLNRLTDTESDMTNDFDGLLYNGRLISSIKNSSSQFKKGTFSSRKSGIYQFNNGEIIASFDKQVENEYKEAYMKAIEFANRYFNKGKSSKNKKLVQKILFLICNDNTIPDDQKLYIYSDGSTAAKSQLKKIDTIEFEAFLLGVWHYFIKSQRLQKEFSDGALTLGESYREIDVKLLYNDNPIKHHEEESCNFYSQLNKEDDASESNAILNNKRCIKSRGKEPGYLTVCDAQMNFYPSELDESTDIISILEKNDVVLSRSVFFYLLSGNIYPVHPKRSRNAVEKLFLDLLKLTVGDYHTIDFEKSVAQYFPNKFKYLQTISQAECLDSSSKIKIFSNAMQNNYTDLLQHMIRIRKKYFCSASRNQALVVELIEFIRNDHSIEDTQQFFICTDGTALTKQQLCEIEGLEFEPFLLGVWYYVVSQLASKDDSGEYTLNTVFKLTYNYNGKDCERYRSGDLIFEQSDLYIDLFYLDA